MKNSKKSTAFLISTGSRIRCIARAVNVRGEPGHTYQSDPVKVSGKQGLCPPREVNTVGADPFTAELKYLGNFHFYFV